jgi:hypothetical protein
MDALATGEPELLIGLAPPYVASQTMIFQYAGEIFVGPLKHGNDEPRIRARRRCY